MCDLNPAKGHIMQTMYDVWNMPEQARLVLHNNVSAVGAAESRVCMSSTAS